MAHLVVKRHLQLDWRRWLTGRVVGRWMVLRYSAVSDQAGS
jgi:ABC-type uncharacterized transport system fused permease/ATPase subunit